MRCASRSLSYWFTQGEAEIQGEAGQYDPLFFVTLTLLAWFILARRKIDWSFLLRRNAWLFAFFAYMGLSILWADPAFTAFKRYFRTVGDLSLALVVMTEPNSLRAVGTVIRRTVLLLIPLSVVLAKYYGQLGRMHEKMGALDTWRGVTIHKNSLGQLCAIAALYYVWNFAMAHWRRMPSALAPWLNTKMTILYLGMTVFLLNGNGISRPMTSILAALFALAMLLLMERYRNNLRRFWWGVLLGAILCLFLNTGTQFLTGRSLYDMSVNTLGKDPTLTDRTTLWADLLKLATKHPWLGAGYMSFWTPENSELLKDTGWSWGPMQAHSGYLETYLHLGLVGLILLAITILIALRRTIQMCSFDFERGRFHFVFLIIILVANYTESSFGLPTNLLWFLFLLVALDLAQRQIGTESESERHDHAPSLQRARHDSPQGPQKATFQSQILVSSSVSKC